MNLGLPELVLLLSLGFVFLIPPIWAAVDAGSRDDAAFAAAGTSKTLWIVLPLVGVLLCGIVGVVFAIFYFVSIRPKLLAPR